MRLAYDLSGSTGSPVGFDPAQSKAPGGDIPWEIPIYDTLLHYNSSGALVPGLATSATINDPQTVTVELRPNLTFSDGTVLDANAVKAGFLRNKAAPQHGQFSAILQNVTTIDVASPTTLTVHLNQRVAGAFFALLAGAETFIPDPNAQNLNAQPIGAGPFKLKTYVPTQRIILVKNPSYWNANSIHLAEIDFISVSGGPQQVNAIQAGTVDFTSIPVTDVATVNADHALHVYTQGAPNSMLSMPLCKSSPPLNNVQVRQALNYAIDRDAINRSILHGAGEPQWALWPKNSVFFPSALNDHYAYNPTKAKQLLAEAGYSNGFNLKLILEPDTPVTTQTAEVVQSEWKQIGVNLTLTPSTNFVPDVFVNHVGQTTVLQGGSGGLGKLNPFHPGALGDLCGYDDPTIDSIVSQLNALAPTSTAAVSLWDEVQTIIINNALAVGIDFLPVVVATSTRVIDPNIITSYILPMPDYHTVYVIGS